MTKAEEILEKHLAIMDAETMIGKHGRTHKAVINAINEAINYTHSCKSDSEQLNVSFNVGDKVLFDNKKAVVLWTSVNYLDIEIVGTNKILQGVHTSKVLPR
jgi:superoxide dismutase